MTLTPLFNIKNAKPIVDEKRVPMGKILAMHREAWDYECSLGTIRLRRMSLDDQQKTVIRLEETFPDYRELSRQARESYQMVKQNVAFSPEQTIALVELDKKLQPFSDEFLVCCFVDPVLKNGEELHHLLFELQPDERPVLVAALSWMSNPSPDGKVETVGLTLAREFGLKLADDLTLENMTAQQATVLAEHLAESRGQKDE